MRNLRFKKSSIGSIGVELEFQLIDPQTSSLVDKAKDIIRNIKSGPYKSQIKPEITQSMIEINTLIHESPITMEQELFELKSYLLEQASCLKIAICGGGSHPFPKWSWQKIFPTPRYKNFLRKYQFLSKMSNEFAQHIHIGCGNAQNALYLTHALSRYVPQLIAISASSPFYHGINTHFSSSRPLSLNVLPFSGIIPFLINWSDFSEYFYRMKDLGVIKSMKDIYWDIRPKPEFGTVEIRVFDTPLTIKSAVLITAYIQSLVIYLLEERPHHISDDLYHFYNQNRFSACRYGFEGTFIDPYTFKKCLIFEDIVNTIEKINKYTNQLGNTEYVDQLLNNVVNKINDTFLLLQMLKKVKSISKVVSEQCKIWAEEKSRKQ